MANVFCHQERPHYRMMRVVATAKIIGMSEPPTGRYRTRLVTESSDLIVEHLIPALESSPVISRSGGLGSLCCLFWPCCQLGYIVIAVAGEGSFHVSLLDC